MNDNVSPFSPKFGYISQEEFGVRAELKDLPEQMKEDSQNEIKLQFHAHIQE